MNNRVKIACCASLLLGFAAPSAVLAQSPDMASLLNAANQMNNEEMDGAKELKSKAGDNQALVSLSDTLSADHKANQAALETLAKQKSVTLNSYTPNKAEQDRLDNLKGAQFNREFLTAEISDHEKALSMFRKAKADETDKDVKVYVDQTVPVLQAHLEMLQKLHHDDKVLGSSENPENNKSTQ
jgi:predicted outer membrane protein